MSSRLFSRHGLRGQQLVNRIVVAPMCQYMATDGVAGDWHFVHLGHLAQSSAGLVIVEATGVTADGRITPGCVGLYSQASEQAFARILGFMRTVGQSKIGIQLSHAGRKASTSAPWLGGGEIVGADGWDTIAPSAIAFMPQWRPPREMSAGDIEAVKASFADAARRADRAGFELVELHAAHGYLLHQFLSPLSNRRSDRYGGSLENRMRFVLEVFEAVRAAFPADKPVIVRLSATDWIEGGWDLASSLELSRALKSLGCDMIHVTSGGLDPSQKIDVGPGYQLGFAEAIRRETAMPTIAVGLITDAAQAETILRAEQADLVAIGRAMLWNPRWVWQAARDLGEDPPLPPAYARSNPSSRGTPFLKR